jgi:hypothetical protein
VAISSQPLVSLDTGLSQRDRTQPRGWNRVFALSFLDSFYISLLIWMFAGGPNGWLGLLVDGDTGWHIRTGQYVLEHGAAPRVDIFSFSKAGQPWFAWEWLADVVMALLYSWSGLKGVVLLAGVLIPLASTIVFRQMMARGANLFIALLIALLGVGASSVHNLARPHVFTTLLVAASLWMVERDMREQRWTIWLLVPLTALWTNLHGGFVALLACLGLMAAGKAIEGYAFAHLRGERWSEAKRYGLLTAACTGATLFNPYGIHLHLHIVEYLRSDWIRNVVQEFQSPSFRNESMLQFEVLLVLAIIAAGSLIRRGSWVQALPILFWAHMSLSSVRHVPIFCVVAGPSLAEEVTRWWKAAIEGSSRKSFCGILDSLSRDLSGGFLRASVWPLVVVAALVILDRPVKWPRDFPAEKFPVDMVGRFGSELARSTVFTPDQWADYLIYRSWPQQRVFFDGRSDFYGEELGRQYLQLLEGRPQWADILKRHRFDRVLVPPEWPLASLLKRDTGWEVVEETAQAILLRRKKPDAQQAGTNVPSPPKKSPSRLMKTTEAAEHTKGDLRG